MKHASLCMGIGGLDLAVESVFGSTLAWYSEIEPAALQVIDRNWDAPNIGDLTTFDWADAEPVDILTAGYPCQPFSHAGKRKGKNDARHLWPFIDQAVRTLRPRYVVLENVRGHLSLGFDAVLGSLAEAGFDAEWCVLRASEVGAPHQRARLFIVAADADRVAAGRDGGTAPRTEEPDGRRGEAHVDHGPAHEDRDAPADARGERHGRGQDGRALGRVDGRDEGEAPERQRPWEVAGDRGATVAGAAPWERRGCDPVDDEGSVEGAERLRGVARGGEAPADADELRRRGQPTRSSDGRDAAERGEALHLADDGAAPRPAVAWGDYAPAIERWELLLGRPAPRPVDDANRLSPPFVEWMMGYPAGWVDGLTRTQALKALGNAVVPQQGAAALRILTAAA